MAEGRGLETDRAALLAEVGSISTSGVAGSVLAIGRTRDRALEIAKKAGFTGVKTLGKTEFPVEMMLNVATVKAFLVAAYFMHLISEKKAIYATLAATTFFVIALAALTLKMRATP